MKALIVYDSYFGNTEKIALAIGDALGSGENILTLKAKDIESENLKDLNLLIVGSPTRAFRPTKEINYFLDNIPADHLKGVKVAAFDTRVSAKEIDSGILKTLVKFFGYAAEPIAKKLQHKGGEMAVAPEGFYVQDSEGPLKEGELERAVLWAKKLVE